MGNLKKMIGFSALGGLFFASSFAVAAEDAGKRFASSGSKSKQYYHDSGSYLPTHNSLRRVPHYRSGASEAADEDMRETPKKKAREKKAPKPRYVRDSVDKYTVRLNKKAPATAGLGQPFAYNYTVKAKQMLKRAVVTEQIPEGATYVSSDPEATVEDGVAKWTLRDMAAGETRDLTLKVKPEEPTDLTSCATVEAFPQACTTTRVGQAVLAIEKSTPDPQALLDSRVPWTIEVTNTGDLTARDVVVTDMLPGGVKHASGGSKLTKRIGALAPGETRELTVDTTAVERGEHANTARATASNAEPVEDDASVTVVEAGLDITKEGPGKQFVGKQATYQIEVTNTGDTSLSGVTVSDTAPSGTEIASASGASVSQNTATWNLGSLAAGQSETVELTLLGQEAGRHCNAAKASASGPRELSARDRACTDWRGYPAMLIEVIDTNDPLLDGQQTTYVIKITNQGTAPDSNVKLDARLPDQLDVVSTSGPTEGDVSGKEVSFRPYPQLEAKAMIEYRVKATAVKEGDGRFKATLRSKLLQKALPEEESTQVY